VDGRNPSDIESGTARNKGTGTATAIAPISKSTLEIANYRIIQSVLMYWFGQYTPDVSQKKLWMIASSSETQRINLDEEFALQFEDLIHHEA
jgi:hypothetical protein